MASKGHKENKFMILDEFSISDYNKISSGVLCGFLRNEVDDAWPILERYVRSADSLANFLAMRLGITFNDLHHY